jgi:hypothetical protein
MVKRRGKREKLTVALLIFIAIFSGWLFLSYMNYLPFPGLNMAPVYPNSTHLSSMEYSTTIDETLRNDESVESAASDIWKAVSNEADFKIYGINDTTAYEIYSWLKNKNMLGGWSLKYEGEEKTETYSLYWGIWTKEPGLMALGHLIIDGSAVKKHTNYDVIVVTVLDSQLKLIEMLEYL